MSASLLDFVKCISAAHQAQQTLANISAQERGQALKDLAKALVAHEQDFLQTAAREQNIPVRWLRKYDFQKALNVCEYWSQQATEIQLTQPLGTVGLITPQRMALSELLLTVAPAWVSGCPVIAKPSHRTPLVPQLLLKLISELFPPGALQMLFAEGSTLGPLFAQHPAIDVLSFSGNSEIGQNLAADVARNFKSGLFRMSAKNSAIVLDDADLAQAAEVLAVSIFACGGQSPFSISRIMVSEKLHDDLVSEIQKQLQDWKIGPAQDEQIQFAPPTSQTSSAMEQAFQEAIKEGAEIKKLMAGENSMVPALILNLHNCSELQQRELLAPVAITVPTKYAHESVKWANTTPYGNCAVVLGADLNRCQKIAAKLTVQQVWINEWKPEEILTLEPGFKQSGFLSNLDLQSVRLQGFHRSPRIT